MGGTAVYLSEIGSKFVMLPVGLYFGTFIIIGIVASLKDVRKRKKDAERSVSQSSDPFASSDGKDESDSVDRESDELFDMLCERCDDDTYDVVYNAWSDRDNEILDGPLTSDVDDKLRLVNIRKYRGLIEYYSGNKSKDDPELISINAEMMASYLMRDDIVRLCDEETFSLLNNALAELTTDGNRPENVAMFQELIDSRKTLTSDIEPKSIHITEDEMRDYFDAHGGLVTDKYNYDPKKTAKKQRPAVAVSDDKPEITSAVTQEKPVIEATPAPAVRQYVHAKSELTQATNGAAEEKAAPHNEKETPEKAAETTLGQQPEKAPVPTAARASDIEPSTESGAKSKRPTVGYRSIGKK